MVVSGVEITGGKVDGSAGMTLRPSVSEGVVVEVVSSPVAGGSNRVLGNTRVVSSVSNMGVSASVVVLELSRCKS